MGVCQMGSVRTIRVFVYKNTHSNTHAICIIENICNHVYIHMPYLCVPQIYKNLMPKYRENHLACNAHQVLTQPRIYDKISITKDTREMIISIIKLVIKTIVGTNLNINHLVSHLTSRILLNYAQRSRS